MIILLRRRLLFVGMLALACVLATAYILARPAFPYLRAFGSGNLREIEAASLRLRGIQEDSLRRYRPIPNHQPPTGLAAYLVKKKLLDAYATSENPEALHAMLRAGIVFKFDPGQVWFSETDWPGVEKAIKAANSYLAGRYGIDAPRWYVKGEGNNKNYGLIITRRSQ